MVVRDRTYGQRCVCYSIEEKKSSQFFAFFLKSTLKFLLLKMLIEYVRLALIANFDAYDVVCP